jgi:hypothetical protein
MQIEGRRKTAAAIHETQRCLPTEAVEHVESKQDNAPYQVWGQLEGELNIPHLHPSLIDHPAQVPDHQQGNQAFQQPEQAFQ